MARQEQILDQPVAVEFDEQEVYMTIVLKSGYRIGVPLAWYPWLQEATPEQRANYKCYDFSILWPDFNKGLDAESVLRRALAGFEDEWEDE